MRIEGLADHAAVRERLTLSNRLAVFDERSGLSDMGVHRRRAVGVLDLHVVGQRAQAVVVDLHASDRSRSRSKDYGADRHPEVIRVQVAAAVADEAAVSLNN